MQMIIEGKTISNISFMLKGDKVLKAIKQWRLFLHGIRLFRKGYSGFHLDKAYEKGFLNKWHVEYYKKHFPNDVLYKKD